LNCLNFWLVSRVIEEVKFQVAGPIVFNGLKIAAEVTYGIAISGGYFFYPLNKPRGQGGLGNKEKALAAPFLTVLTVGHFPGPGLTKHA